jgi:serine/threonine protein kinase
MRDTDKRLLSVCAYATSVFEQSSNKSEYTVEREFTVEVLPSGGWKHGVEYILEMHAGHGSHQFVIPALADLKVGADTDDLKTSGIKLYNYRELADATLGFNESRLMSSDGAFGSVYHGTFGSSQHVAVKTMRGVSLHSAEQLKRELDTLHRCRHPHILCLVGYCLETRKCLVYEYKERGSLQSLIEYGGGESAPRLSWQRRLCILGQVLSAIEFLHTVADPPIIHRDIKSPNILLDASLNASLGDFGLARLSPEFSGPPCPSGAGAGPQSVASTRIFGTPGYIDPEYSQSGSIAKFSDIFSVGIVALELLSSTHPHDASQDPSWILDRFEDALEDATLERFCPHWPAAPARETIDIVRIFVHRRGRRRPDSTLAAAQVNELMKKWGCTPVQLLAQTSSEEDSCVVCMDNPSTHALLPCGHRCSCSECIALLNGQCPICRVAFENAVQIFKC